MNQDKNNNGPMNNAKQQVANKALSTGAQAMGVPKPIADLGSKAITNMASKGGAKNPAMRGASRLGNNGNFYKNGLNSAPSNNQQNIGKGSHSSPISSGLGRSSSSTGQNQNNKGAGGNAIANKALSTGAQAMGVPKPIADMGSKAITGALSKGGGNNSGPQSTSDQLMGAAKKLITGADPKPPEDAPASVKVAYTIKKWAKILKLVGPIIPYFLIFIAILFILMLVMSQIMILRDKINDAYIYASTGIEKFVNYMTGNGWATEEETFYKTLEKKYDDVATLNTENGERLELDVPLIASTINYAKMSDVGVYEDVEDFDLGQEDSSSAGKFSDYFSAIIEHEQMKSFYYVANNKLGDYRTLAWGHRRLLGHMVGYKIKWEMCTLIEAFNAWVNIITEICKFTYQSLSDFYGDFPMIPSPADIINPIGYILDLYEWFRTVFAYEDMGPDHDSYFKYQARNVVYEFQEFLDKFKDLLTGGGGESELEQSLNDGDDGSKWGAIFPAPKLYFFMTLDRDEEWHYGHYLENVYIPGTFFSKENHNETKIDNMVDEIFDQRKYYEYLVGDLGSGEPGGPGSGTPNCNDCLYDLSTTFGSGTRNNGSEYSNVGNIKVTLHKYYDSPKGGIIEGAENIDFEKYVMGVVFAEIGPTELPEYAKSQAVAARSYALTRPFEMGNKGNTKWEKNGDNWILHLRGSVVDQVYCDPDQGCSKNVAASNQNGDVYPGANTKPNTYKKALDTYSTASAFRQAVSSTAGQVILNSSGYITNAPYTAGNGQQQFYNGAKAGKLYTTIIPEHYTKRYGQTMTIGEGNCSPSTDPTCTGGGGETGEWANWKQYDSRWGSIPLGNRTIKAIGCAATSVAIQLARSGATLTFSDLNPGTFVTAYKAKGGFTSGGSIYFDQVYKVAPNFKYAGRLTLPTSKNGIYDAVKAKVDAGYYVVMEVKKRKGGQHWVAVVSCQNDTITMADPASKDTDVFAHYGYNGISDIVYYKIEG